MILIVGQGYNGSKAIKFKDEKAIGGSDQLKCFRYCLENDEIFLSSKKGAIIRQKVQSIPRQSRQATGVKIQEMAEEDKITNIDFVHSQDKL